MISLPQFPDTFPTVFPHHTPFTIDVWSEEYWEFHGYQVEIGKGRPMADTPKSWKRIGYIEGPASGYSPRELYVAKGAKDAGFRWSQYRDGCFYAFHGRINILWHEEKFSHEVTYSEHVLQNGLEIPAKFMHAFRRHPHRAVLLSKLIM